MALTLNTYKIGDVSLESDRIEFRTNPGTNPSTITFVVSNKCADEVVSALKGKREASISIKAFDNVNNEETELALKNFVFHPVEPVTQYKSKLSFSDRRFWWSRKRVTGFFNVRRKANEYIQIDPQGIISVNREGYLVNTLNADSSGGSPWSAQGILLNILKQLEPNLEEPRKTVPDNGYILDNQVYYGEPLVDVLNTLMGPAYIMLDHDPFEDKIYFYRPDAGVSYLNGFGQFYKEGGARMVSFSAIRPKEIRVGFLIERQLMLANRDAFEGDYTPPVQGKYATVVKDVMQDNSNFENGVSLIENVLQLPANLKDSAGNIIAQRGQWLPVKTAIELWAQEDARKEATFGQSIQKINSNVPVEVYNFAPDNKMRDKPVKVMYPLYLAAWFGNLLQVLYGITVKLPLGDPVRLARVASFYAHFRQTYKIEANLLGHILKWHTQSVDILDAATGARGQNPVFTQYCVVPSLRPPEREGIFKELKDVILAKNVDDFSGTGIDLSAVAIKQRLEDVFGIPNAGTEELGSPFIIQVLDHDLGIFKILPLEDLTAAIGQIVPSMVDNVPFADYNKLALNLWQHSTLTKRHQIRLYLTAFLMPREGVKYENIESLANAKKTEKNATIADAEEWSVRMIPTSCNAPSLGDTLDIFSRMDTARFRADGTWVNQKTCEGLTIAEGKRIYFAYRDRPLGVYVYRGLRKIRKDGHVMGVSWLVDETGEASTVVDFRVPPTPPPVYTHLDPNVRKFVFRQIGADSPKL